MTLGEQTRFEQLRTQLLQWRAGAAVGRSVTAISNRLSDDDKRQELLATLRDHLSAESGARACSQARNRLTACARTRPDLQVSWPQVHALSSRFALQLKASPDQVGAGLGRDGCCV